MGGWYTIAAAVQLYHNKKGLKAPPPPTCAASAGPEDHNSEVKLYDAGINKCWCKIWNIFPHQKRVVWQGRIEIETSAASAVRDACCSIVAGV